MPIFLPKLRKQIRAQPAPTSGAELPYDGYRWNARGIKNIHNCYDYALNNMDPMQDHKSQPGESQGVDKYGNYQCESLEKRIYIDNPDMYSIGYEAQCNAGHRKIALYVSDTRDDYHFLRQDNDGTWSHKVGEYEARNTDFSGKKIIDPRFANLKSSFRDYPELCGFYCVNDAKHY